MRCITIRPVCNTIAEWMTSGVFIMCPDMYKWKPQNVGPNDAKATDQGTQLVAENITKVAM